MFACQGAKPLLISLLMDSLGVSAADRIAGHALTAVIGVAVVDRSLLLNASVRLRLPFRYRARPAPIVRPTSHPTKSIAKMDDETLAVPTTVSLPEQWWACRAQDGFDYQHQSPEVCNTSAPLGEFLKVRLSMQITMDTGAAVGTCRSGRHVAHDAVYSKMVSSVMMQDNKTCLQEPAAHACRCD